MKFFLIMVINLKFIGFLNLMKKWEKNKKEKMRRKKERKNEKEIEIFDDKGKEYDDFIV